VSFSFTGNVVMVISHEYIINKWNIKVITPNIGFVDMINDNTPSNPAISLGSNQQMLYRNDAVKDS
jgi:hypothetical protein